MKLKPYMIRYVCDWLIMGIPKIAFLIFCLQIEVIFKGSRAYPSPIKMNVNFTLFKH